MKKLSAILLSAVFFITGCSSETDHNTLRLGTIVGPETDVIEVAVNIAKQRYDLTIIIVPFTDYILPNSAVADGSIDANAIQHVPYLTSWMRETKHDNLVVVGKTFIFPIAAYSKKHENIDELPAGAIIAIPNDPSNQARALLLLQDAELITLDPAAELKASVLDITHNPHKYRFRELEAAQLARVLRDVDLAVINTTFASPAGLSLQDGLIVEGVDSPYANIIVTRADKQDDPRIQQLVDSIQSDEVLAKAKTLFNDGVIAAW